MTDFAARALQGRPIANAARHPQQKSGGNRHTWPNVCIRSTVVQPGTTGLGAEQISLRSSLDAWPLWGRRRPQEHRPAVRHRGAEPGIRVLRAQRMLDPSTYRCSSPLRTKLSPPFSGPRKSPTAAGFWASGLGVRERNDTVNLSPNADFSPKLGAWPIYSTSFFR
jgi:hypothetical protein